MMTMMFDDKTAAWDSYIRDPLKRTNGYLTTYKSLYKIQTLKLCRHFSYTEIARVKRDGNLCAPIYLASVGKDWEDTNKNLAVRIRDYVNEKGAHWVDLGAISC